jgi:hypothetical protein
LPPRLFRCELQPAGDAFAFTNYYTFSQAYELEGPLATSLAELFPALIASNAAKMQYQGAFYSGNNTYRKSHHSTNWPVYWCGIGFMDQQEFFTAVNNDLRVPRSRL